MRERDRERHIETERLAERGREVETGRERQRERGRDRERAKKERGNENNSLKLHIISITFFSSVSAIFI